MAVIFIVCQPASGIWHLASGQLNVAAERGLDKSPTQPVECPAIPTRDGAHVILFISDLHLDPSRPEITGAFLEFLRGEASEAEALYILGDLFEVWIGDDDPGELGEQVAAALRRLHEAGIPCYFQHGNRDFLLGRRFARQAGLTLLPRRKVLELYGKPTLLMHGDLLCTRDKAYQRFRLLAQNPFSKFVLRHLPLSKRRDIARGLRQRSTKATTVKSEYIMDVTAEEVLREINHHGVVQLIHGHTHRPAEHHLDCALGECRRYVLGDWHDRGWVLRATPEELKLESFSIAEAESAS